LGKLAKDINLSIQDLSLAELIQTSMGSPGEHLDQARNQVTDVLLMTEQATLNIMDLVEEIREDCQSVQTKLLSLAESQDSQEGEEFATASSPEGTEEQSLWDQVLSQAEALDRLMHSGELGGASPVAGVPSFSLGDILQIILEFCTNEKVKQHLRAVQSKQDAVFRGPEAERALSLLAAGAPREEGFYQLPLEPVLELLKSHCEDERVRDLFTKMASSADKLFPVTALPLEAKGVEEEFADESPEFPGNPDIESRWDQMRQTLKLLSEHRQAAIAGGAGGRQGATDVQMVLDTVDRITKNLSRIIEALSFQDLSGQRLLKILKIIRQLQVQVLTLLVAAGDRLQTKLDDQALAFKESDQAREELDRLLTSFAPGADQCAAVAPAEQPLDQTAINELLTTMGF
jgi:chemotaxis regulatin CheY-phosphate phosphatase CheZ